MVTHKETEATLADLLLQLKIGNRLIAAQLRATMKQKDLILLLRGTGASHAEIGLIVGTTSATVQNTLARTRRAGASRRPNTETQNDG